MSPNQPHTILYVHSSDEMYGADQILLELVKGLDRTYFRPVVVVPTDVKYQGLLSKALNELGIKTIPLKTAILRRKFFTPWGIPIYLVRLLFSTLALVKIIHQERVEIVHSNTAAVIPGALASFLTRKKHVWHIHEIIVHPRVLWRFTSWLLPRLSDQVVAVSEATRQHLCNGNARNKDKSIVIYNGIDPVRFEDVERSASLSLRQEWDVEPDQILIGMLGRISHWKGQEYFLDVANLLSQVQPDTRFALVGGTFPGQEDLAQQIKARIQELNISSKVILSDFRSDIPVILGAYDIFVLPSTLPDPFPTVVLEAMASKKPIVANAHGGSVEMVENKVTGFLVPPDKPEKMAESIEYLVQNPEEREKMGRMGFERLKTLFSRQAFIEKWTNLYQALLTGKIIEK
jgi:glycosyltransferase involved in cell wall biosynthesis